jgi:hypothetical protein
VAIEFYPLKTETVAQSAARWRTNLQFTLAHYSGSVGVIPALYSQGGAPPDELWTEQEILDRLAPLTDLVNTNPRVDLVAPFIYQRANGIEAHPPYLEALNRIIAASPGLPAWVTTPIPPDPIPLGVVLMAAANPNDIRPLNHVGTIGKGTDKCFYLAPKNAPAPPPGKSQNKPWVWSVQANGELQTRDANDPGNGAFETFKNEKNGGAVVNNVDFQGNYWPFVPFDVSNL